MKELINKNYESIVLRGMIKDTTTKLDFIAKIYEEVYELEYSADNNYLFDEEELADVILVCLNMAKHHDIDIEKVMKDKIKKNFNRANKVNKKS